MADSTLPIGSAIDLTPPSESTGRGSIRCTVGWSRSTTKRLA